MYESVHIVATIQKCVIDAYDLNRRIKVV